MPFNTNPKNVILLSTLLELAKRAKAFHPSLPTYWIVVACRSIEKNLRPSGFA